MTRPAVVVGDSATPARRPSLLPALAALAAIAVAMWALQSGAVRTADAPPPGLQVVATRTWEPAPGGTQWTVSRVYSAPGGGGLAFTARRGAGSDTPPIVRAGGPGEASLVEWNHLGFRYTILAVGIPPDDVRRVAEGIVYDRTGLGTTAVPRPGDLPDGLFLVHQRSGPSAGPGTGPTGSVTELIDPETGARVTVTVSHDPVVTAAHLASLLRPTSRSGSRQLVLDLPGDERWLVADRADTTVVARGAGVTPVDLARALARAGG